MKRNRQAESSLLLGLSDMVQEDGALAGETASRAAAALAHYPGGDSWMNVLADFAAQGADQQTSWCGIAALILSGDEKNTLLAARKAQSCWQHIKVSTPQDAYIYLPGLVLSETKTGTRGKYFDYLKALQDVPAVSEEDLALVMETAVECMEWMDQAVYEVYRGFQAVFENCLARLSRMRGPETEALQSDASVLFSSCALLRACRLGAVLTSEYAEPAEKTCARVLKRADESTDPLIYAASALVYAEGIRNRDYRDYGRKNGGVLWS